MAVYLRPYEDEPLPTADELEAAAKLLGDHDFPLALIRAINGEALIRHEADTLAGRTLLRAIHFWFDVSSWLEYDVPGADRVPWWRVTNRVQDVRRLIARSAL
jgi:hypothetical protein